jgi:hypothetical protein
MYNPTLIQTALRGLVGFESNYISGYPVVDSSLLVSTSGIYVNNLHPLLTYENLLVVAEQFSAIVPREWVNTFTYKKGDIVKKVAEDVIYQSLQNTNLNKEVTEADWWVETNLLSAYLRRVYDTASIKLFGQLFTEKKLNEAAKTLLSDSRLYEGTGNITGRVAKSGRVVGYKISLKHKDTVAILSHIGLQLDTVQNPVNIYLYHTSSDQPIQTFALNHTRSIQFQWHSITQEILSLLNDDLSGGSYRLVYYEDQLTGNAIKKEISFSGSSNCGSCTEKVVNANLYSKWSKYISIQPFYVNAVDLPGDNSLWDEDKEIYTDNVTYGLNLQLTIHCDVTGVLVRSKSILADALAKQIKVDLLYEMAYSVRDNQLKQKLAGLAAIALDDAENGQMGAVNELKAARKALSFDLSGLSDVCLKCDNRSQQIRVKSIFR